MNLFKTLTVSILTSSLLIACSNDKEQILDSASKQVTLSLSLPKMAATRGLDPQTSPNDVVLLEGDIKVFAKQSETGAIVNTFIFPANTLVSPEGSAIPKSIEVNGTARYIEIDANFDNEIKTKNVTTRQGGAKTSVVRVTGGAPISQNHNGQNETCSIQAVPEMARFEIIGSLENVETIRNLQIKSFYLNNIRNNRDDIDITKVKSNNWSSEYTAGGSRDKLYDEVSNINKIPDEQAYGYNFFPQTYTDAKLSAKAKTKEEAAKYHPHMILKVSFMNSEGEQQDDKYLNVIALKDDSGNYFESFDKGKVYQLDLSSLKDIIDVGNPPVTDMPDPDAVGVEISVSVKGWEVVTVEPEI